jgi:hypothetical protein
MNKENKIDADKFYFVDSISSYIKELKPAENCYFAPAPYELESIKKDKENLLIEESLPTFDKVIEIKKNEERAQEIKEEKINFLRSERFIKLPNI